jgi:hypothetical protein
LDLAQALLGLALAGRSGNVTNEVWAENSETKCYRKG